MAGSALALGVLAVAASTALGIAAVGGAAVTTQRIAGAADAAALAAADVASGAVVSAEDPCAVAGRVANASGAVLEECLLDGLIATVRVTGTYAGLPVAVSARAGPGEGA